MRLSHRFPFTKELFMKLRSMVTPITLVAALLAASTQLAFAQEATPDTWQKAQSTKSRADLRAEVAAARAAGEFNVPGEYGIVDRPFTSTLTRAEVLADLRAYRESGLAELDRGEAPAFFTPQYAAAEARYAQLRASAQYATRSRGTADHAAGE
jgi:hypothetical protein